MSPASPVVRRFPDVETVVQDMVAELVGGVSHVGSETPADLQGRLPFIRVTRYGGGDDGLTDVADIDVDCYGRARTATLRLAEQVRELLTRGSHEVSSEGARVVVDQVTTILAPFQPPGDGDETVRRFTASYSVRARRTPTT